MSLRGWLGPYWQVLRHRRPAAAARAEDLALAARGRSALVSEVRALRGRLADLERDHLLLAAHVASLTEHAAVRPLPAPHPAEDQVADARQRARVAAVAGYEQRIGALEEGLTTLRRAHRGREQASGERIPRERAKATG